GRLNRSAIVTASSLNILPNVSGLRLTPQIFTR
ncbi:MAG: hypothetical protein ACI92S_002033, partial [Planctomycetaceae bacterium]